MSSNSQRKPQKYPPKKYNYSGLLDELMNVPKQSDCNSFKKDQKDGGNGSNIMCQTQLGGDQTKQKEIQLRNQQKKIHQGKDSLGFVKNKSQDIFDTKSDFDNLKTQNKPLPAVQFDKPKPTFNPGTGSSNESNNTETFWQDINNTFKRMEQIKLFMNVPTSSKQNNSNN